MTTKPLLRVLDGEAVWPPPVWLMRQAGRYLPEYRAVRDRAGDFISLATTPALAAEVTLQPVRRFGMDGAILFSDILIVPWALGQGLRYETGEGPMLPPIETAADVAGLDPGRVPGAAAPVGETVSRCAGSLAAGGTALIGFAGGVWTVACYMVEGGGSKDFARIRLMAWHNPALLDALVAVVEAATIEYLDMQVRAGADCVMLFDTWAGLLPPALFARYVTAPSAPIIAPLRERHGAGLRVADVLPAVRGRAHVFNLGHGIVPQTPPEHVAELVAAVRGA